MVSELRELKIDIDINQPPFSKTDLLEHRMFFFDDMIV